MWLSEGRQDGRLVLAHLGGPVCSQGEDSFPKQEGRAGVSEEVSCGAGGWTGVGPLAKECGQPVLPQGFQKHSHPVSESGLQNCTLVSVYCF